MARESRLPGNRRRASLLCLGTVALALVLPGAAARAAGSEILECDAVRRLADNYLLDLRIRMALDGARHRYVRYEDVGRGWERVGGPHVFARYGDSRIVLEQNPYVTSYIEPLTGAYYYIDRSGITLSVWAHCGPVGMAPPLF